jgi:hypothetical protein
MSAAEACCKSSSEEDFPKGECEREWGGASGRRAVTLEVRTELSSPSRTPPLHVSSVCRTVAGRSRRSGWSAPGDEVLRALPLSLSSKACIYIKTGAWARVGKLSAGLAAHAR